MSWKQNGNVFRVQRSTPLSGLAGQFSAGNEPPALKEDNHANILGMVVAGKRPELTLNKAANPPET
jgi:hypothetical protein